MSEERGMNDSAALITDLEDIKDFDRRLWEVTEGYRIRTGSLLKVGTENYAKWGIGLTKENRPGLMELVDRYRAKDLVERERTPELETAGRTATSNRMRTSLRRTIAMIVASLVRSLHQRKEHVSVWDLAAGHGELAIAIAIALGDRYVETVKFTLLDESVGKLGIAQTKLMAYDPANVDIASDMKYVRDEQPPDIVVSAGHLHTRPFTDDLLRDVHTKMADGGIFLSGDWHSPLCSHPAHIHRLLEALGVEDSRIRLFESLMGEFLSPDSAPRLTTEEMHALDDHIQDWIAVRSILKLSSGRLYVFGAFDTSKERTQKLNAADFQTNPEDIRRAFPGALIRTPHHLSNGSDSPAVILGMKRRG